MECLRCYPNSSMKEDTHAPSSGRGELHEGLGLLP